jgi:hypothetical protein
VEAVCKDGRDYAVVNNIPEDHYNNIPLVEWLFYRINYCWPERAIELAAEMLQTLDSEHLSDKCKAALDVAVDLSAPDEVLREHKEMIKGEITQSNNHERAIHTLIRWRLREKWRPSGPFVALVKRHMKATGVPYANKKLIMWLKERVSLEMWLEKVKP